MPTSPIKQAPVPLLESLDSNIRDAVIAGSFRAAATLLEQYRCEVERQLRASGCTAEGMAALQHKAFNLFDWVAALASAARGESERELAQLRRTFSYQRPNSSSDFIHRNA